MKRFFLLVKENINLVSFITGIAFIVAGQKDVGELIVRHGAAL